MTEFDEYARMLEALHLSPLSEPSARTTITTTEPLPVQESEEKQTYPTHQASHESSATNRPSKHKRKIPTTKTTNIAAEHRADNINSGDFVMTPLWT